MSQNTSPQETDAQKLNSKLVEYEKLLQQKDAELQTAKGRITQLEDMVAQVENLKQQRVKDAEDVDLLKNESEKTLTKAKSIIFERTKVIKNQELQIEALTQQNDSLKDVVRITKDLLEIRNLEVKQLENKINCMEERVKAEKERQDLMHKKLEAMIRHNGELKREYEAQLCLFQALRERYNERELARGVIDDMRRDIQADRAANNGTQTNGHSENSENAPVPNPEAAQIENPATTPDGGQVDNPENIAIGNPEVSPVEKAENSSAANPEGGQAKNPENVPAAIPEGDQVKNQENPTTAVSEGGQVKNQENLPTAVPGEGEAKKQENPPVALAEEGKNGETRPVEKPEGDRVKNPEQPKNE